MVLNIHRNHKAYWGRGVGGEGVEKTTPVMRELYSAFKLFCLTCKAGALPQVCGDWSTTQE